MKKEIFDLVQRSVRLEKLVKKSNCTNCLIMQHYLESEYQLLKTKILSLERVLLCNEQLKEYSILDLQRSMGVMGLYIMV